MSPNREQAKSALRWIIVAFGMLAVGQGWVTKEQVDLLGGDQAITVLFAGVGLVGAVASGVWGLFAHSQATAVAVVAAMPEVAKVEIAATPAGRDLAGKVGSSPEALVTLAPPARIASDNFRGAS